MRIQIVAGLIALAGSLPVLAQPMSEPGAPVMVEQAGEAGAAALAAPAPTILLRDTPIEMMATSEIRSDTAPAGTRFKLRVNKPVIVDGQTVVPVGSWAHAEVVAAKSSSGLGKSGTMSTKLLFLQVGEVQIPLEGESSTKGQGAGSAGVAVLLAGWSALFHRGNNAKIKAGELVNGFVAEDIGLDMSTQPVRRVALAAPAVSAAQPQ
jgi:hypothetical protein